MYFELNFEVNKLSVEVLVVGNRDNIYFICLENYIGK